MGGAERPQSSTDHRGQPAASSTPTLALSRKDAAAALGMSLRHFQRHVQPQLRCIHSGQLRLYPLAELERWTDANISSALDKW